MYRIKDQKELGNNHSEVASSGFLVGIRFGVLPFLKYNFSELNSFHVAYCVCGFFLLFGAKLSSMWNFMHSHSLVIHQIFSLISY